MSRPVSMLWPVQRTTSWWCVVTASVCRRPGPGWKLFLKQYGGAWSRRPAATNGRLCHRTGGTGAFSYSGKPGAGFLILV